MAALISGMVVTSKFYHSLPEQAGLEVEYRSNLPMKVNLINDLNNLSVVDPSQSGAGKGVITLDNMRQSSNVSEAIKDLQLSISVYNKEVQTMRMRQKHPVMTIPIIKTEYIYRPVMLSITRDNKLELVDTP
jgi:hypothetical protein